MKEERQKCTGVYDKNRNSIYIGDTVRFMDKTGVVCFESGAYGIGFDATIDWDKIETAIPVETGCDNSLYGCFNDNFISFWEILWNFNCEEELCYMVEIIIPTEVKEENRGGNGACRREER